MRRTSVILLAGKPLFAVIADRLLVLARSTQTVPAVHHVRLLPLHAGREVGQHAIRLARRVGQAARVELLHARDPSLDQKLAHRETSC